MSPNAPYFIVQGGKAGASQGKLWRETSQAVPTQRAMVGVKLRLLLGHFFVICKQNGA